MLKVDQHHTRARKNGTILVCPYCDKKFKVYHFKWDALNCPHCKFSHNKTDYYQAYEWEYPESKVKNPLEKITDKNPLKVMEVIKKDVLSKLITFHEETMDAISEASHGHTPDWKHIMKLSQEIEDDYDLESFK